MLTARKLSPVAYPIYSLLLAIVISCVYFVHCFILSGTRCEGCISFALVSHLARVAFSACTPCHYVLTVSRGYTYVLKIKLKLTFLFFFLCLVYINVESIMVFSLIRGFVECLHCFPFHTSYTNYGLLYCAYI